MCQQLAAEARTNDGTAAGPLPLSICPLSHMSMRVHVRGVRGGGLGWQGFVMLIKSNPPPPSSSSQSPSEKDSREHEPLSGWPR